MQFTLVFNFVGTREDKTANSRTFPSLQAVMYDAGAESETISSFFTAGCLLFSWSMISGDEWRVVHYFGY